MNYQRGPCRYLFIIILYMLGKKRWEIRCVVIITIIIFKRSGNGFTIYRCKNRFTIGTLFVVRSRIAYLISHVILPDRRVVPGRGGGKFISVRVSPGFGIRFIFVVILLPNGTRCKPKRFVNNI